MIKVITVRTLSGIEYNAIYEPTGVLLPEGVTKAWVWGLITDEEYKTLMEVELSDMHSMEVS